MTNKKLGGIYSIEDGQIKWDMMEILSGGSPCNSLAELIEKVYSCRHGQRFFVCPMPALYDLDLENVSGAASPIDAMRLHVELLLEGYSFYVWDTELNVVYLSEKNEYIYQPLEDMIEIEVRRRIQIPQSLSEPPRLDSVSLEHLSRDLSQETSELLHQASQMLLEYTTHLECDARYEENPYDQRSILGQAEKSRSLAGKCYSKYEDHNKATRTNDGK